MTSSTTPGFSEGSGEGSGDSRARYYTLRPEAAQQPAHLPVSTADIVLDPAYAAQLGALAAADAQQKAQNEFCGSENLRRYALKMAHDARPKPPLTAGQVRNQVLAQAAELDVLVAARLAGGEPGYVIDEGLEPLFRALCLYFARDPRFETEDPTGQRLLRKGILLAGNVGAGKTTLLRIFRRANPGAGMSYSEASFSDLELAYNDQDEKKGGPAGLARFCKHPFFIDDMGREELLSNHYGTKKNVFDVVLEARYHHGVPPHTLHMTSNLSELQMYRRYDKRIFSRLQESFNILGFPPGAKDRRTQQTPGEFADYIAQLEEQELRESRQV